VSTTEIPAAPDKARTGAPKKPATTTIAPTIATAEIELPPGPTFAPIVRAAPMTLLDLLFRRPAVQPRVAQVLVTGRGQMLLSAPDNPLPTIDLLTRGVRRIYEVDLGRHETYLHALLPSSSAAADFVAVIDLHWRVVRAVDVVNDGITDVGSTLRPRILVLLRDVTRHHTTDDLELAEKKAAAALQQENLGEAYGLEVTAFLRLGIDSKSKQQARLLAEVDRFRTIIAAGDLDRFALQLAQNPSAVEEVVKALMSEREKYRRDTFAFLTRLIESRVLEPWEIADQVREALHSLQDAIHTVIPGTEEARDDVLGGSRNAIPQ
jgi:hypothetical protein